MTIGHGENRCKMQSNTRVDMQFVLKYMELPSPDTSSMIIARWSRSMHAKGESVTLEGEISLLYDVYVLEQSYP